MNASAPGKLMLCGEYAALEGGIAAVMAVDRRARAHLRAGEGRTGVSPFLAAARAALESELGAHSAAARAARRVDVDTSALCAPTGEKLGLGSSAAATTAALAACLGAPAAGPWATEGGPPASGAGATEGRVGATEGRVGATEARAGATEGRAGPTEGGSPAGSTEGGSGAGGFLDRTRLHRLAHRAHAEAQASLPGATRGSGVDIAASVWGGVLAVMPPPAPGLPPGVRRLTLPPALDLVCVWTAQPADTRALVAGVTPLRTRDPATWRACLDELSAAASAFISACDHADAAAAVTALAAGAWAVGALGRAAQVPLETDLHRRLAALAEPLGGALKPTGAGGGDVALAGFAGPGQAEQFRADVAALGITVLDLGVDPRGAALEPSLGPS